MIYIRKQVRFEGQQQQRKQPSLSGVVGALFRACVVCTRTVRLHRCPWTMQVISELCADRCVLLLMSVVVVSSSSWWIMWHDSESLSHFVFQLTVVWNGLYSDMFFIAFKTFNISPRAIQRCTERLLNRSGNIRCITTRSNIIFTIITCLSQNYIFDLLFLGWLGFWCGHKPIVVIMYASIS